MDKRKKLNDADIKKIHRLLKEGVKGEAIIHLMGISHTHFYRIQQAYRNGEINLKRTSLHSLLHMVENGLPFRRVAWPEGIYYYYAIDEPRPWFVQVNMETGNELITYSLDLNLEDLKAKDWVVLTWESVNDHVVDANEKVVE
jgi:hypothetical protein